MYDAFLKTWAFDSCHNEDEVSKAIGIPDAMREMIQNGPRPTITYQLTGDEWACITDCFGCEQKTPFKLGEGFETMAPMGGTTKVTMDVKNGALCETHVYPNDIVVEIEKTVDGNEMTQVTKVYGGKELKASGEAKYKVKN